MRIAFDAATPITDETFRACSTLARRSGHQAIGTATPHPQAWLLIEEPGPWGREVTGRDPAVAAELREVASASNIRLQWIRRHDRSLSRHADRRVFACWSARTGSWMETFPWSGQLEDLDLDRLAGFGRGEPLRLGTPTDEPLVLVCTHGGVDACCAKLGRPIAAALSERFGSLVWEMTHVGGCRFAANVMCLPAGVMYGQTDPGLSIRQVEAFLGGQVIEEGLRGHAGVPAAAQVAELAVRRRTGVWELEASRVTYRGVGRGYEVRVETGDVTHLVTVEPAQLPEQPYGCGYEGRWTPTEWHVTGLRPVPMDGPPATA